MTENYLRQAFDSGTFIHTAELVLGRDYTLPEAEQFIKDAAEAAEGIKVISLTDLPGGNPAVPPESFATFLLQHQRSPLIHITSKDGNRTMLEGRLYSLARIGVENMLSLSGDAPTTGFDGKPKPVYDLDAVQLVRLAAAIRSGMSYQVGKRTLQVPPMNFLIGAVVNPFKIYEPALMTQFYKMELKIRCGAQFIITQLGYNLRKLYELKQYMSLVGLAHIPVLANVYVPTATVAKMMQSGEVPGCVIPDKLIQQLEQEKKPQRIERAALMVAAAKSLGFAGAHIGGFGLTHQDFLALIEQSEKIGEAWRDRIDDLVLEVGNEDFYLFPTKKDGLSEVPASLPPATIQVQRSFSSGFFALIHNSVVSDLSPFGKYFEWRMKSLRQRHGEETQAWRRGLTYHLLDMADLVKRPLLGCVECGDCLQDYMKFSGCSMGKCIKETRNGPCGGSRSDGTCEVNPDMLCVWSAAYKNIVAAKEDPHKFAENLVPPRNWNLNRTNSLANYFAKIDNNLRRKKLTLKTPETP